MENNRKGNGIFLGVIGVATLIVAIIGATFAYFSATANSATDAINVTSTTLSLGYNDDTTGLKTDLIPAYDNIALLGTEAANVSANGECIDDNKNNICGVYTFSIGNPSATTAQRVYGRIEIMDDGNANNDFENLYFRIYEMNGETRGDQVVGPTNFATASVVQGADGPLYNGKKVIILDNLEQLLSPSPAASVEADTFKKDDLSTYGDSADGNNVKDYMMVVWLRETGNPQNTSDGAKSLTAGIVFTTEGGTSGGVTGVIGTTVGANEAD